MITIFAVYRKLITKIRGFLIRSSKRNADIVLLGDSNTLVSHFKLFSKERWSYIVEKELGLDVANLGRNGASTIDFLDEKTLSKITGLNAKYYIICFGLNDKGKYPVSDFEVYTRKLISHIQNNTNGIPILMTTISAYYPPYLKVKYEQPREIKFESVKHKLSKEYGLHLIDVFSRFDREAEQGNWDTRIRTEQVWDDFHDKGKTIESGWFDNIHYNVKGSRIVAEEIVEYVKENILRST